jgi:hypothetical protein
MVLPNVAVHFLAHLASLLLGVCTHARTWRPESSKECGTGAHGRYERWWPQLMILTPKAGPETDSQTGATHLHTHRGCANGWPLFASRFSARLWVSDHKPWPPSLLASVCTGATLLR